MATLIYDDLSQLDKVLQQDETIQTRFFSNPFYVDIIGAFIPVFLDRVERGEEMRVDKLVWRLHGQLEPQENFLLLNGIINPFSIKQDQLVLYTSIADYAKIRDTQQAQAQIRQQIQRRAGINGTGTGNGSTQNRSARLENGRILLG